MEKIAIVGYGHVGKAVHGLFKDAVVYDKYLGIGSIEDINSADIAFVCVPTPTNESGCDTSIVEEVVSWLRAPLIIIRSTVYIGFTDSMKEKYHKRILFQPEYYGETKNHPFSDEKNVTWVTLGGDARDVEAARSIYEPFGVQVNQASAKEAEMAKYMCNCFLATKVTFANEMYDLAERLGIDYDSVKKLFLEDPRIGKSHLDVYPGDRGFGGHCFPKDTKALSLQAKSLGLDMELLDSVIEVNGKYRKKNSK